MSILARGALLFTGLLFQFNLSAQVCAGTAFPNPKQKIWPNVSIPNAPAVKAYVEHLPDDYSSNPTKKYPLIVWFHGAFEVDGDPTGCRFFGNEWFMVPPVKVERGEFPASVRDQAGATYKYILISPHMSWVSAETINPLLDYLIRTYRVDASRIYLSGISSGANILLQYVGNDANAKRVAAIAPLAPTDVISNANAQVVSRNNLHVYSLKCGLDHQGDPNGATIIANTINNIAPSKNLAIGFTLPTAGRNCPNELIPHVSWDVAYDATFRPNIYGRNVNLWEWMIQFRSAAAAGPLPVALEDYTVRLSNGKVHVRWSTSTEENSDHFSIERSGNNQQFASIATVASAGNSGTLKTYEWVDEHPLSNINYYRLTQTDRDGQTQYFPVRKILNRVKWDRVAIVSPNPFNEQLSVFINVDKIQRVGFTLADMSGRIIKTMNGIYNEGNSEITFDTGKLPRGVYILKIEGEFFSEMQRVVKQ